MLTTICTIIFVVTVLVLGIFLKKTLYIHEHDASIEKELKLFDENLKKINDLDVSSNYKLGSNHIYSK
ncbi:hypothetical protein Q4512_08205 [Oceanihabitans sp. 2_MG-2023]|uniref:hypothetical protein n=1 Tax=Oceanihabitans sp. 2_MG-2023 TaxID=3062661 RepID=UPI0026E29702|nr:hypothetical protein [Oceanihabitans sp. 2_MG-2023]MDO6596896.1 hypothetical protein [Oceanihabitans sp. 2_MG-2023]